MRAACRASSTPAPSRRRDRNLHRLGPELVTAASSDDLPLVVGIVVCATIAVIVCNLVVDLAYAWLDPRIRLET